LINYAALLYLKLEDKGSMTYVADGNRAQKPILSSIISSFAALTYIGIGITSFCMSVKYL